jgi:hypothetical protein
LAVVVIDAVPTRKEGWTLQITLPEGSKLGCLSWTLPSEIEAVLSGLSEEKREQLLEDTTDSVSGRMAIVCGIVSIDEDDLNLGPLFDTLAKLDRFGEEAVTACVANPRGVVVGLHLELFTQGLVVI